MRKIFLKTGDGSTTIQIPEWNEQYHSTHGALTEALYVFIEKGFHYQNNSNLKILEMGFGTGLNALLTKLEAEKNHKKVDFTTIEAFPLAVEEIEKLNYPALLNIFPKTFIELHVLPWEERHQISPNFSLKKRKCQFSEVNNKEEFNLIYFDAFGIRVQPELWTEEIFKKMYDSLQPDGVLVTYASNGHARRAMQTVGFLVERLPGPPGKKQMMRAIKK